MGNFVGSLISWVLPPIIYATALTFLPLYKPHSSDPLWKRVLIPICLWPLRLLFGFPIIYIKMPLDVILETLANLKLIPVKWTEYDVNWKWFGFFRFATLADNSSLIGFMKLFEQLGEAIPKLILATIYYFHNYDYVWATERVVETPLFTAELAIPITLMSMIFSAVSVGKGIISGVRAFFNVM